MVRIAYHKTRFTDNKHVFHCTYAAGQINKLNLSYLFGLLQVHQNKINTENFVKISETIRSINGSVQ